VFRGHPGTFRRRRPPPRGTNFGSIPHSDHLKVGFLVGARPESLIGAVLHLIKIVAGPCPV